MTTPKPVRRPSSEAISPVRASELPCGAAMTTPRCPSCPEILPGRPSSSGSAPEGAQPETTSEPIATLVAHQNRLRERIVTVVGQREQYPDPTPDEADLPGASRQDEGRRFLALPAHLELTPAHPHLQAGAQRLEAGLLGGEARRKVGRRIAPRSTIGDFVVGEHPAHETILPAVDRRAHPGNAHQIDADARDLHCSPIWARMSPARSSAIARMRAASAPSIMTRARDSVPEWRFRTRPRPRILCAMASLGSAIAAIDSVGGLRRTGMF